MPNLDRVLINRIACSAALAVTLHATDAAAVGLHAVPGVVRIDGLADGDLLGISADRLGDFNGDGIDDFVVAAEEAQGGRGSAYVVYGRRGGLPRGFSLAMLDGRNGFRIDGEAGEGFNSRARSAGDLNADGRGDLALAHASAGGYAGRVCVVFGGRPLPAVSTIAALESGAATCFRTGARDNTGREVAALGDTNGDGIDDLAIGAPLADHAGIDSGSVHIVHGRSDGFAPDIDLDLLDGRDGYRIDGVSAGDNFGLVVAAAGDVDADGLRDIAIGAELAAGRAGAAYVVFGRDDGSATRSASALSGADGFRVISGGPAYGRHARKLGGGGDLDGDGIDDLAIGAPFAAGGGIVSVVYGRRGGFPPIVDASLFDGRDGYRIDGFAAGDAAGDGVAAVGDLDRDGIDDLAVGAQHADAGGIDAGSVRIVSGASTRAGAVRNGAAGIRLDGSAAGEYCGLELRTLGDIDADGRDELLASCHLANAGGHWRGSVYVMRGGTFERRMFANGFE